MNVNDLPLLDLFNRLRKIGLQLGIDDYTMFLKAIQAGFGIGDQGSLQNLCCTLWTKTESEAYLFRRLFAEMFVSLTAREKGSYQLEELESSQERKDFEDNESKKIKHKGSTPGIIPDFLDENALQVVQAIRRASVVDLDTRNFFIKSLEDYFPISRRQMKQSWRYLRRTVREGPAAELDIAATIEKVGRDGIIVTPVLIPYRTNISELVLFIDQDGSMVPFHNLTRHLVDTASRGGRLRKTEVYYFHDYPAESVFKDSPRLNPKRISEILSTLDVHTSILIVSDAGAARGTYDYVREQSTRDFLSLLSHSVRYFAWLNPVPNDRWKGTTAERISSYVPMFDMSKEGFLAAINTLRGLHKYPIVRNQVHQM